jgi:hypothetical protein
MTANHAHTPLDTTWIRNRIAESYADPEVGAKAFDHWLAERDARIEAAAEQRGAAALAFELFPLMRHLQDLPSRYTRAPGPGGNGDRVADLLSQDAYKIGAQAIDIISEAMHHTDQEGDDDA